MKTSDVLPVVVSILVIILVAVVEKYSKLFAAIVATMPLGIPLALWIVYAANDGKQEIMESFTRNMAIGIVPTVIFAVAIWLAARAGLKLVPMLLTGYVAWAVTLLLVFGMRRLLGG
jgi:hypothetical protein